jgi:hypothetical protein
MTWNLRLVNMGGDEPWVELREVFYDHVGKPIGHTPALVSGENIDEIKTYLIRAVEALDKPILTFGKENGHIGKDSEGE